MNERDFDTGFSDAVRVAGAPGPSSKGGFLTSHGHDFLPRKTFMGRVLGLLVVLLCAAFLLLAVACLVSLVQGYQSLALLSFLWLPWAGLGLLAALCALMVLPGWDGLGDARSR